ncbi:MAG: hypothetical protein CMG00_04690, partial [Candidatus Marinimicrobia bacterium]|nr:hypothetical protein [Candidatus Neomarinimicrobiota bacterium]
STVNVQIIHNSASPTVDVWVDGTVAIASVAYRTATTVLELPKMFSVAISAAGDTDVLYTEDFDLEAGKSYVVVASGLLGDLTTPFILNATETTFGATDGNVGLEVYHGSTDAPPVDILANGTVLIPNLAYGQFSGYSPVAAADYQIGIAPAGGAAIAVFDASLSGLGGGSAVVFASGFLSPAADQPAFSVLAALANGTVLELPSLEADCAGIWGGGAVEDCAGVCNGSAVEDACGECGGEAIDNSTCGQYYNVMLDDTGVSALVVFQAVITTLDVGDEIGVFDMQGLVNNGCGDDAQYGEILVGSGVWTGEQLNMTLIGSVSDPCDFGGTALPGYRGGNALEIRVMHKINSDTDLYPYEYKVDPTYVIGDGTFPTSSSSFNIISELGLGEVLDNEDVSILPNDFTLSQNYPNPFNPVTDINFSVGVSGEISIEVYDIIGNHITTLSDGFASPGNYKVSWDGTDKNGTNVSSGVYIYTLITPNQTISKRMLLIK